MPSVAVLEEALRKEAGLQLDDESRSVNSIRKGVEKTFGLEAGFFANDDAWKVRSRKVIKDEFDALMDAQESLSRDTSPNIVNVKMAKPESKHISKKRSSPVVKPPKKKQKISQVEVAERGKSPGPSDDSEADSLPKQNISAAISKTTKRSSGKISKPERSEGESDSELSDVPTKTSGRESTPNVSEEDSGSEMSVLIDEEPRSRKTKKLKQSSSKPKKMVKPKAATDDDPDQQEIKRLQGWLVKCGVRKIWAFELKGYETPKAKIKHLKEMLSDVGMTGRFSLEKAGQIKEARELAADIEAVQEGNEIWGKDGEEKSRRSRRRDYAEPDDDEEESEIAPAKKLVRGPKRYDFLSSDGEESD